MSKKWLGKVRFKFPLITGTCLAFWAQVLLVMSRKHVFFYSCIVCLGIYLTSFLGALLSHNVWIHRAPSLGMNKQQNRALYSGTFVRFVGPRFVTWHAHSLSRSLTRRAPPASPHVRLTIPNSRESSLLKSPRSYSQVVVRLALPSRKMKPKVV
jgi:hypothetical protein